MSGSGISWAICKSASRSRQITTPAPHHWIFLQAGCPSCRPANSVKALEAEIQKSTKNTEIKKCKIKVWKATRELQLIELVAYADQTKLFSIQVGAYSSTLASSVPQLWTLFPNSAAEFGVHTRDARETSYLFQRISITLQRFNSVLLHDTLPFDLPDLWPSGILILAFLVFNHGDLYYLRYKIIIIIIITVLLHDSLPTPDCTNW